MQNMSYNKTITTLSSLSTKCNPQHTAVKKYNNWSAH